MAMTLRLTEEQTERLRETARREGKSMHTVAVEAIERRTTEREQRVADAARRTSEEHAELFRRLADT